ncbi:MAG: insulinase family protein, partial [Bacteroidia bacterium]|nr:insulinase family protein [Bacteroidia bacterium]
LNLRVYPTVPQYHRDEPALDILGVMMGNGNNSIFYKNFVKAKPEIAVEAGVNHRSKELAGEFSIQIFAYPPEDFNLEKLFTDVDAKVKATIDEFGTSGITDESLARAKAEIESGY